MDWMSDGVSRFIQSPAYLQPLLDFIDENCAIFEDKEENKLEYSVIHDSFKQLVDGLISDYLSSLDVPVHEFVQNLARHMNEESYDNLVNSILTVDDFALFKDMMLKRNSQLDVEDVVYEPMDLELFEGLNLTQKNDMEEVIKLCHRNAEQQKAKQTSELQRTFSMSAAGKEEKDEIKPLKEMSHEAEYLKIATNSKSPRPEISSVTFKHQVLIETSPAQEKFSNSNLEFPTKENLKELIDATTQLQPQPQDSFVAKRRDHTLQQREQSFSQKKVEREKQIKTADEYDGRRNNPYLQQYLKRESFAKPTSAQDAEAIKRRETLMKDLELKLKDELATRQIKTSERKFHP